MADESKQGKRFGTIALKKIRDLDLLMNKLETTTIGDLDKRITINLNKSNKLSQDIEDLKAKKGLCPQSLII